MRVFVDPDICLGCGICEGIAPDVFSLGTETYAVVQLDPVPENLWADVRDAAEQCPEEAIRIEE
jgi:ferredoxin